ncbi:MAG: hypothetical protein U0528_15195 [Anaerolineae bacterium]
MLNATVLKLGSVAPEFWLETPDGQAVNRHDFRNKAGLIVVLLTPSEAAWQYVRTLAQDDTELRELKVRIIAIARVNAEAVKNVILPESVTLLVDPKDKAWTAYTGLPAGSHPEAMAVYVLDLYGGLEAQRVVGSVAEAPEAETVLDWSRGAQYRCNI